MKSKQEGKHAEYFETESSVRGIEVVTQRTLDDSMRVERPEPEPDGKVERGKVEEDTILVNPDADSMESRG